MSKCDLLEMKKIKVVKKFAALNFQGYFSLEKDTVTIVMFMHCQILTKVIYFVLSGAANASCLRATVAV